MFGLTYMQQISETSGGAGLHVEPGIWANVPTTTDPTEPATVVRMASIPHGTVILAQGTTRASARNSSCAGQQHHPLPDRQPSATNSEFANAEQTFTGAQPVRTDLLPPRLSGRDAGHGQEPEQRAPGRAPGAAHEEQDVHQISTKHNPVKGGGTANTAFLASGGPPGGNANATEVDATFWIETIAGTGGQPDTPAVAVPQLVQLDFNGLRWPHVTVATLRKQ